MLVFVKELQTIGKHKQKSEDNRIFLHMPLGSSKKGWLSELNHWVNSTKQKYNNLTLVPHESREWGDEFPDSPLSENETLSVFRIFHAFLDKYYQGISVLGKIITSFNLDYESWLVYVKVLTGHNGFCS